MHQGTVFDHLDYQQHCHGCRPVPAWRAAAPDTAPGVVQAFALWVTPTWCTWTASETGDQHPQFGRREYWDIDYCEGDCGQWLPLVRRYNQYDGRRYLEDESAGAGLDAPVPGEGPLRRAGGRLDGAVGARRGADRRGWRSRRHHPAHVPVHTRGPPGAATACAWTPGPRATWSSDVSNSNPDVRVSAPTR